MRSGAIFSDDKKYRYSLWRDWDAEKVMAMFIMLNPSTADEVKNDPTIERCERRVKALGYGGLTVCNLFAFRSTSPKALYEESNPVGMLNNFYINWELSKAGLVVCGWGAHGKLHNRQEEVLKLIVDAGHRPHVLMINKDGTPKHPLYVSYDEQIKEWPHD